jgi:hypothetical protein
MDANFGCFVEDYSAEEVHNKSIIGFPRGRLVLEAQDLLLEFLYEVVKVLTEDMAELASLDPCLTQWIESESRDGFVLSSASTNRPFSAPPVFNIDEIHSRAQVQLDRADGHLVWLQCNPWYLSSMVQLDGRILPPKSDPIYKTAEDIYILMYGTTDHGRLLLKLVSCSYSSYDKLSVKAQQLKEIVLMNSGQNVKETKFAITHHAAAPSQSLLDEYHKAIKELEYLLFQQLNVRSETLERLLLRHHSFRDTLIIDPDVFEELNNNFNLGPQTLYWPYLEDDRLFWILRMIAQTPTSYVRMQLDHSTYFAMLEEHLSIVKTCERNRLDDILFYLLEDLAVLHDFWFLVHQQRPVPEPYRPRVFIPCKVEISNRRTVLDRRILRVMDDCFRLITDHDLCALALWKVVRTCCSHLLESNWQDQWQTRINQFSAVKKDLRLSGKC